MNYVKTTTTPAPSASIEETARPANTKTRTKEGGTTMRTLKSKPNEKNDVGGTEGET